jgi:hypothetical protein
VRSRRSAGRGSLEFIERLVTRSSPARTRRSGTLACFGSSPAVVQARTHNQVPAKSHKSTAGPVNRRTDPPVRPTAGSREAPAWQTLRNQRGGWLQLTMVAQPHRGTELTSSKLRATTTGGSGSSIAASGTPRRRPSGPPRGRSAHGWSHHLPTPRGRGVGPGRWPGSPGARVPLPTCPQPSIIAIRRLGRRA